MFRQFIRFGIVGGIASVTDIGVLVLLKELFHFGVLFSAAVSFCISVTVNYLLSMSFVFKSKNENKTKEFISFVLLSVGGLGINELILWLGTEFTVIHYLILKIFAMGIEMIYNFITRKVFLESKEK